MRIMWLRTHLAWLYWRRAHLARQQTRLVQKDRKSKRDWRRISALTYKTGVVASSIGHLKRRHGHLLRQPRKGGRR